MACLRENKSWKTFIKCLENSVWITWLSCLDNCVLLLILTFFGSPIGLFLSRRLSSPSSIFSLLLVFFSFSKSKTVIVIIPEAFFGSEQKESKVSIYLFESKILFFLCIFLSKISLSSLQASTLKRSFSQTKERKLKNFTWKKGDNNNRQSLFFCQKMKTVKTKKAVFFCWINKECNDR